MSILVIEDNSTHLKLAHHVLSAAGYDVRDAQSVEQALIQIKSHKPRLILLDLALAGMDGMLLVKQLKADLETAAIHIVAVTSFPERYSKTKALAEGCADYIVKPINTRTLAAQLSPLMK